MDVNSIAQLGCFDVVLCSGVLHHFENLDLALHKIKMVLMEKNGVLISHEPQHDYFKSHDAAFVATIRHLLSILGFWHEPKKEITDIDGFDSYSKEVHREYVFERDDNDSAQSPNDLEHDRDDILAKVKNNFEVLDIYQSSSFIYRLIGGLRHPEIKKEHELAKFLALVDRALVNNGALAANYFYFCARVNSL
jgi:SAM-dependent methyltransferase